MKYYVYCLIDPRDGEAFYIGKGQGKRMFAHAKAAIGGEKSLKCQRIRDILAHGYDLQYKIDSRHSDEKMAYKRESDLIKQIGLDKLTNVVAGGGGVKSSIDEVETICDVRKAIPSLVNIVRNYANGYKVMLGNVDISEMALKYISSLIDRHGKEPIALEFHKYNIEVQ